MSETTAATPQEPYVDHEPRMDYYNAFPAGIKSLIAWGKDINQSGLEHSLLELVKMRASQMNGCAFCLDMHTREAMEAGETAQRLAVLPAWREATVFTPRERAALQWVETITNIQQGHAPEAAYREMRTQFNEAEAVQLTMAIANINVWNRMAIAFRPRMGKRSTK